MKTNQDRAVSVEKQYRYVMRREARRSKRIADERAARRAAAVERRREDRLRGQ